MPIEDYEEGLRGDLAKVVYGIRGAASNWEDHCSDVLAKIGFY